ncbi:unnamed protein product [Tenebrio molitor]|nr:unnamed protein product [Tenebrio molitor]
MICFFLETYLYFTIEIYLQKAMTSLVMDNHKSYDLQENCKTSSYPEVQFRQKSPGDASETQRKKRAKNRLSNRRSTGFVFEDEIEAAMKLGPEGDTPDRTKQ